MAALIHKKSKTFSMAASSSSAAPASPPWIELPDDLTANILRRLSIEVILMNEEFDNVCRCTVDLSRGQLVDLKVMSYDQDYGFLNYVAKRSSQLRCLTLAGYDKIGASLTDAIKKLPRLEELHLIRMPPLSVEQLQTIGVFCPALKSFTYKEHWHKDCLVNRRFGARHAVAIGNTMPNLRHLRLWEQRMSNEGLEAILDGCPHLESLDLRRCNGLDLEGALGKRCSDRIKHMRLPSDDSDIDWLIKYPEYDESEYENENGNKCEYEYDNECECSNYITPPGQCDCDFCI
ncbi:putative F-box/LRR-repeat protein 23 [Salvia divinorum]|uniref:F-box/LRR-repeat protein 23 n=1 Tax=Salvia divinorum TaxID=28513 RepID=A0ABD1HL92_SALDI